MTDDAPSPRSAPEAGGVVAPVLLTVDLGPCARGVFTTRQRPVTNEAEEAAQDDPYQGLNLAAHVGDDPRRVRAARRALEAALGLGERGDDAGRSGVLAWMDQVHSATVATAYRGAGLSDVPRADALVLDLSDPVCQGVAGAGVLVADCVPLLLASQDGGLVAAVHAGRRGMLDGVVEATLTALSRRGVGPRGLWAAIGPCICGSCYEVPEAMQVDSLAREPACGSRTRWGTPGMDVAAGVQAQLERAGVEHVSRAGWCTYEDERFYSYRRDGLTGRLAGVVLAGSRCDTPNSMGRGQARHR